MCQLVVKNVSEGNEVVLRDVRKITGEDSYTPTNAKELADRCHTLQNVFSVECVLCITNAKELADRCHTLQNVFSVECFLCITNAKDYIRIGNTFSSVPEHIL